ncbi:DrmB family protein [Mucisphaera sp.]|uniref:DrmB family protein n=1 Tax=Mucisphaera sp. TaxID=2913024 RepID=UPI003D124320
MSHKAHGQVRQGQVITTWGPGALIDLPQDAAIIAGLDTWPKTSELLEINEPRLVAKLERLTGMTAVRLFAPPSDPQDPREPARGIGAWRFPEWFVVQMDDEDQDRVRSRRLVPRKALDDRGRFDGRGVIPTRFVRACPNGHVDDLDWWFFVHGPGDDCRRQLWLDERGTSGDLAELVVRCECGKSRNLYEAAQIELNALGTCRGARPWLGRNANEDCKLPSRLLVRTASNAYFPQVLSVLSIPDERRKVDVAVDAHWEDLQIVDSADVLKIMKRKPDVAKDLDLFSDGDVLDAIERKKSSGTEDKPVKQVEVEALLAAPEGYGDDVPIDPNFHARRLPDAAWRSSSLTDGLQSVIQVHRLREVLALSGFTRFEAITPDIHGDYDSDVVRAELALEPSWFPAVENRGEGVFIQLRAEAISTWMARDAVKSRLAVLSGGHDRWAEGRKTARPFPGGPYLLLHTLSHLLIQSISLRCGYPASSLRERIFVEPQGAGILLYTASADSAGTLGGLVQQARHLESHLRQALRIGALCSNDPICAQHSPSESMEGRWLHGASCHGCCLIAETSCEMRNDYLDRSLVVDTLSDSGASFFGAQP